MLLNYLSVKTGELHMTLSRFFKQYLYIPLGGNRGGYIRMLFNLLIVYVLSGFWHGAGWLFLFWGLLHGFAAIIHKLWQKVDIELPKAISWIITFNFINITWVFFRATTGGDVINILSAMFGFNGGISLNDVYLNLSIVLQLLASLLICIFLSNSTELINKFRFNKKSVVFAFCILIYSILNLTHESEFLYFNF